MCRSALIPGWGHLYLGHRSKAVLFGLGFLVSGLLTVFSPSAATGLAGLITLGESPQTLDGFSVIPGDHSLHLLVDGLITLLFGLVCLTIYLVNLWQAFMLGRTKYHNQRIHGFLLVSLLPGFLLLVFFIILPFLLTLTVGFTDYRSPDHLPPRALVDWVGLQNFGKLISLDLWKQTLLSVGLWNIIWAVGVTGLSYFLGMGMSGLLANHPIPWPNFWKILFLLPYALPTFFSLLIMRSLFSGTGPINLGLGALGLPALPFLTDPLLARITIILVNVWLTTPFFLLLTSSARTTVGSELYEAAALDGAGSWTQFRRVTLPLVWETTLPVVLLSFFFQFNNLAGIYLLTEGNPSSVNLHYAGQTDILISWIYKLTLFQGQYNLAAVLTTVLACFLGTAGVLMRRRMTEL